MGENVQAAIDTMLADKENLPEMTRRFRRLSRRLPGSEAGFTLVELLVVVGVIVALAAVIVPSVVKFSGKGETGAKAAEGENVQAPLIPCWRTRESPV